MKYKCDNLFKGCQQEAIHFYDGCMLTNTYIIVSKSYGALCDHCMEKSIDNYTFYTIPYEQWLLESILES